VRVLSWNLFHGRAVPDRPRPLLHEFASALEGWSWDVALLQEVPPWWPPLLARACGAEHHGVLTSRHELLPLRRAVASRRPDLARSNGGGANAILVRAPRTATAHARRRLRLRPERRVLHAVSVEGLWIGNVHAEPPPDGPGAPAADVVLALERLSAWGGSAPLLLGGDLTLRPAAVDGILPAGWARIASRDVDHVLVRGPVATGPADVLPHRGLSDHPPLVVEVRRPAGAGVDRG
jgi:endonuclease/exonuclease/phosphatase family metal-dependent hydrolase